MPADIVLVDPPEELWRIEWKEPPLRYSFISASDAAQDNAGNRFDIPGVGVLYAATRPVGAFAETTAQFRPNASLIKDGCSRERRPSPADTRATRRDLAVTAYTAILENR